MTCIGELNCNRRVDYVRAELCKYHYCRIRWQADLENNRRKSKLRARKEYKRRRKQSLEWHKKNPRKSKLNNRKFTLSKYGLTFKSFNQMFKNQAFRCKICRIKKKLFIDHCHKTGKLRGLLCARCNFGLGNFKDSKRLLYRAANYLTKTK